jgi:hypothetical protein
MLKTMTTESFLMAVERFLAVRPRPSVFLADKGTNFHGRHSVLEKLNKIDISEAQEKLNIEFRFAPHRAPHYMGLVERIVSGVAKAALKPTVRTAKLMGEELRTVLAKTMGLLSYFPIAYTVRSNMDFHYQPVIPNHFLLGQPYTELKPLKTSTISAAKRYQRLAQAPGIFGEKIVTELSTHLHQYNNWVAETRGVKVGDIALLLDPKKRGLLPLVQITHMQTGLDGHVRRVTVFDRAAHFMRAITSLALLVLADAKEGKQTNAPTQPADHTNATTQPVLADHCSPMRPAVTRSTLDARLRGN